MRYLINKINLSQPHNPKNSTRVAWEVRDIVKKEIFGPFDTKNKARYFIIEESAKEHAGPNWSDENIDNYVGLIPNDIYSAFKAGAIMADSI